MSFETISVIGLGYIGLPTAAMFASRKKRVMGVDVSKKTVETINRGQIHIVEPDLDSLVSVAVSEGYLKAVTKPVVSDAFLIAVPTPFKKNESPIPEPDLSYIEAAARSISPVLKRGDLVVLESTSPVGTTEFLVELLSDLRPDLRFPQTNGEMADIYIAHCPERVLPGHIVKELVVNDRVIGGISSRCSQRALELYKIFVEGECVVTNARTAEMSKLTENSCRDVQIAFANELSIICDKLEIDVWELIALANRHPRINILEPGPGVGGHCIAVDPWFIVGKSPDDAKLIHTARNVNDFKPDWVLEKVKIEIAEFLQENIDKTISEVELAVFGLAFKPDIDDLRESPAMYIATTLANQHVGTVYAVEPNIESLDSEKIVLTTIENAIKQADIIVLLVDHKEFNNLNLFGKRIIDTKGLSRNKV